MKPISILLTLFTLSLLNIQCSDSELTGQIQNTIEAEIIKADSLSQDLTGEEIAGILFMREEEKLARDVYLYLYDIFPLRPFLNISKSEQVHMDAIKYLIDLYELNDPVGDNPEGVFQNETLQELYNELVETGSKSEIEALKVGALIEEIDIIDLEHEMLRSPDQEELMRVFQNLCNASENHLRAFVRVLGRYDVEYEPVKLDIDHFNDILAQ